LLRHRITFRFGAPGGGSEAQREDCFIFVSLRIQINIPFRSVISDSNFFEGQMRTNKITRGPHSDDDETMAVPEPC